MANGVFPSNINVTNYDAAGESIFYVRGVIVTSGFPHIYNMNKTVKSA